MDMLNFFWRCARFLCFFAVCDVYSSNEEYKAYAQDCVRHLNRLYFSSPVSVREKTVKLHHKHYQIHHASAADIFRHLLHQIKISASEEQILKSIDLFERCVRIYPELEICRGCVSVYCIISACHVHMSVHGVSMIDQFASKIHNISDWRKYLDIRCHEDRSKQLLMHVQVTHGNNGISPVLTLTEYKSMQ